ncbi:MAG: serine/threonine protein kinase [Alphaproteobacteria bacterium]|nr:serine/threonine protein kinase [Alphaproteobacteria bacterium]
MTTETPAAPHYKVLRTLGAGGFGTVYHARFVGEGGFAKEVALKVLNPELQGLSDVAQRLRDEARMLGLLRHRAIVQVDRLTRLEGTWAVAMEYIEGADLQQLLRLGPVPLSAALEVLAEVAGALNAAWRTAGPDGAPLCLMHRDLKPANLRVTPFGEVKVLDFGIAKAEFDGREALTRSTLYGTPLYLSPERQLGQTGPKDDVYALGVIFYEMLCGRRFGQSSPDGEEHALLVEQRLAKAEQGEPIPPAPRALLLRMLAFDPQARPSAEEVEREALALRAQAAGEPLRYWAEQQVPKAAALAQAPEGEGSLSVGTLIIQGEDRSGVTGVPAADGTRPLLYVALLAAALVVALVGLRVAREAPPAALPSEAPTEVPEPAPAAPPTPTEVATEAAEVSVEPATVEPAVVEASAPSAPAAAEVPQPVQPPPLAEGSPPADAPPAEATAEDLDAVEITENPAPEMGEVSLVDLDGSGPQLLIDGLPFAGGALSVGTHSYQARFSTGRSTKAQSFTVDAGARYEIRCSSVGPMCVAKAR